MKRKLYVSLCIVGLGFLLPFTISTYGAIPKFSKLKKAKKTKVITPGLILKNWGLDNKFNSHVNARKAWEVTKGSKSIVVAVIDTGIDPKHKDLKDNLWRKAGTNEYGWDFVTNKKNPGDNHGHGSHVSGIIGATAKANAGAAGVARNVSIMAIRYYAESATGSQNLKNTIKAIHYAIDNGAHIINYSGGGAEFSAAELKAIKRAEKKGIIVVAAAGNEHQNTDKAGQKYYPAAYGLSNIISVAATNIKNKLFPSSNWGKKNVDVTAPGENIFSTLPKQRYGYLSGTSQATAFVSGLAALILTKDPSLKPHQVKKIIMSSVDPIDSLKKKIASGGRINAFKALASLSNSKIKLPVIKTAKKKAKDKVVYQPDFSKYEFNQRVIKRRKVAKEFDF